MAAARRNDWAFTPEHDGEGLLSDLFQDCRSLAETQAKREEELKRYVENVAHQIKTPLQGLTLQLDLLAAELGENAALSLANAEAARIGDAIGRLLTLARLRAGRVRFQTAQVDLDELLAELLAFPLFASVRRSRTGGAPALVTGDPDWLRQAVMNLLQNAVTHGENAALTLDTAGPAVRLLLENDAPHAALPEDPFLRYAVEKEDGSSTGVGLSIAKEAICAQGGRISMTMTEEHKARTEVFLPVYRFSEKL